MLFLRFGKVKMYIILLKQLKLVEYVLFYGVVNLIIFFDMFFRGNFILSGFIDKVDEYFLDDLEELIFVFEVF